jgi:hypothetical protein
LPNVPQALWFFGASTQSYLTVDDEQDANGLLAATIAGRRLPTALLALGAPLVLGLAWPATARLLRRAVRVFLKQTAVALPVDASAWHRYEIVWEPDSARFLIDGRVCHETVVLPAPPLALVIWIDNQMMAWPPDGKLRMGTLANPRMWLDLDALSIQGEALVAL